MFRCDDDLQFVEDVSILRQYGWGIQI